MPMLSTIVTISLAGITLADRLLDAGEALRGFLDPGADRHARMDQTWPESTAGKKLLPRKGTSRKDSSTTAMKPITKPRRRASAASRMPR